MQVTIGQYREDVSMGALPYFGGLALAKRPSPSDSCLGLNRKPTPPYESKQELSPCN
jgi:hypothetical protein